MSRTGWGKLERVQLKAGRAICGMLRSAPCEAVNCEVWFGGVAEVGGDDVGVGVKQVQAYGHEVPRVYGLLGVRNRLRRVGRRGMAEQTEVGHVGGSANFL